MLKSEQTYKKRKEKRITCTEVFTAFAMTLKNELRHILFPLIILEMFLQFESTFGKFS